LYIQELTLETKNNIDKNELVEQFHSLLYVLHKSGQSQSKQEASFLSDTFIRCNIQTLEKNSLDNKYNSEWVIKQLEKLESLSSSKLQVKTLGTTYEKYSGVCQCKNHKFLVLYTHLLNDAGALDCGNCFKPIPLYRFVNLDPIIREHIISWEENYIACDRLQIGSTVGEKWATKQMTDYNSPLSKEGIAICSKIKLLTGIPTYYYLFNYRRLKVEQDKNRLCPSCSAQWLLDKPLNSLYDFKCDKCELISSLTSNSY